MSLSDVKVTILIDRPTPILGGFGKPLISGAGTVGIPFTNYANLTAVKADYDETTAEYKAAASLFLQKNRPAEIAIVRRMTADQTIAEHLDEMLLQDWHFLVTTSTAVADIIAVADKIEADGTRQYIARTASLADANQVKAKAYDRTTTFYHPEEDEIAKYPDAAWIGAAGSLPVGSVTWKRWTLNGIAPAEMTQTELNTVHAAGAITYVKMAGMAVTSEGKAVSGEYIDLVHSRDYLVSSIQFAVQDLFNRAQEQNTKIPYDNTGIAQLESAVRTVLQRSYNQGMIASDGDGQPMFTTTFPPRSAVDPANVAARSYPDGRFSFVLAGAIHTTTITGVITFE